MNAYNARISGHVLLSCDIDRFGLAEWCKVASEIPQGQGFGAAAMELRPTFKLTPATGPDGPVDAVMSIAVDFRAPASRIDFGRGRDGGPVGERAASPDAFQAPVQAGSDITMFGDPLQRRQITMLERPRLGQHRDVRRLGARLSRHERAGSRAMPWRTAKSRRTATSRAAS